MKFEADSVKIGNEEGMVLKVDDFKRLIQKPKI